MIKIEYKDGSFRIIRPTATFYHIDKRELTSRKVDPESIILDRIKALANSTGYVYKISALVGESITLEHVNSNNKPEFKGAITPETYKKWRAKRKSMLKTLRIEGVSLSFSICTNPKRKVHSNAA